jgi:hypothetical protein
MKNLKFIYKNESIKTLINYNFRIYFSYKYKNKSILNMQLAYFLYFVRTHDINNIFKKKYI